MLGFWFFFFFPLIYWVEKKLHLFENHYPPFTFIHNFVGLGFIFETCVGVAGLGSWIWIWEIEIQIPCLDSLKRIEDLDLKNPSRVLNLKS